MDIQDIFTICNIVLTASFVICYIYQFFYIFWVFLGKDNKKFQISKVASGARFKDYRGCIEWLRDAGIVNICYCMNFPELPLKGNCDESKYKLYFFDSGIFVSMLDEEAQEDLRANKNLGVYKGALYENIVGEALVKCGYDLYYYKKDDSYLEEDFFVRTKDALVPAALHGLYHSIRGTCRHLEQLARASYRLMVEGVDGQLQFALLAFGKA